MDDALRTDLRWLWLGVQQHRCGVCGVGAVGRYGFQPRWVLDYDRSHGVQPCVKGRECVDCVQGTTCRLCMLHLGHFRKTPGYMPRGRVNGLTPAAWTACAQAYTTSDFRSLVGRQRQAEG